MVSYQLWKNTKQSQFKGLCSSKYSVTKDKTMEPFQMQENFRETWQLSAEWSECSIKNIIGIIGEFWVRST